MDRTHGLSRWIKCPSPILEKSDFVYLRARSAMSVYRPTRQRPIVSEPLGQCVVEMVVGAWRRDRLRVSRLGTIQVECVRRNAGWKSRLVPSLGSETDLAGRKKERARRSLDSGGGLDWRISRQPIFASALASAWTCGQASQQRDPRRSGIARSLARYILPDKRA